MRALVLLLLASPLSAQPARTYAQIRFKNGGAYVLRDSLGVRVEIGSATDTRRTWIVRPDPRHILGLTVLMQAPLPTDTVEYKAKANGATWRCAPSGCWVTITTPGLGSYFRPTPNLTAAHLAGLRFALVAALQGADVPNWLLDLR